MTFGGGIMDERVAVIGAILEDPTRSQSQFNRIVAEYHDLVRGRMGQVYVSHQYHGSWYYGPDKYHDR